MVSIRVQLASMLTSNITCIAQATSLPSEWHLNIWSAGDDCISIQTGCSNIYVHNVNCGPGHGVSIGGLGKDNTRACVSNVTVRDVKMHKTLTGVRIKTWQVLLHIRIHTSYAPSLIIVSFKLQIDSNQDSIFVRTYMYAEPNYIWFSTAGRIRVSPKHHVFKHSSIRSCNPNHDWPILLWQEQMPKWDISRGSFGCKLCKHTRNLYDETCTFCMQWQLTVYWCVSGHHTAEISWWRQAIVWPFLLGGVRRAQN